VKIHSGTGRTHALEVENDAAVLAALCAAAWAGTAVSWQMLSALVIESDSPLSSF